jgi:hypothetical protein
MRSPSLLSPALAVLLLAAASRSDAAPFDRQDLEVPGSALAASTGDLDGDGLVDLVVAYRRGAGPAARRFLAVFFRGPSGFPVRPDAAFQVPEGSAAFDVGDVVGDARDELLHLTASGVLAQGFEARKPAPPTRLITTATLVLAPEEDDLVAWDFLRGPRPGEPATLLLPTRRELKLYRRVGEEWRAWSSCDVDLFSYYDAESRHYRRSARGGSSGRPYAFRVTTVVPNVDLVEQTGDGRVDLVAHYEDRVAVFPASEDGTLAHAPSTRQWLQLRSPAELDARDTEVSAQVVDLDADGVADLAVTKIGGGITTLRTETRIHLGKKGGGFAERAAQVFADDGFAALVRFEDLDGDGALEMLHPRAEVSVMTMSRAMLASKLDLELRIRRAAPKPLVFATSAVQTLETTFGLDLSVGTALRGTAPIGGADLDGDGRRDLVLSHGADAMGLHRGTGRSGQPFEEDPSAKLAADGSPQTQIIPSRSNGAGRAEVLVYFVAHRKLSSKLHVFRARP